jgi:hypothetical protein
LRHRIHYVDNAQPVPEQQQLDAQIEIRLPSERWDFRGGRLPLCAVARETYSKPRFDWFRTVRQCRQQKKRSDKAAIYECSCPCRRVCACGATRACAISPSSFHSQREAAPPP